MANKYLSNLPQGSKNYLEKVAIVGAGGTVGKFIVQEILNHGKQQVTAITRKDSSSKLPDGILVKHVDYDSQQSLVDALQGQDCLIITMGVTAPKEQQQKLVEAAAAAKVPWVLPNEFGNDASDPSVSEGVSFISVGKKSVRDKIESLGQSSWIGIACNFWYEYSLAVGPWAYGFDLANRKVWYYGDGSNRFNTSTWIQSGRATAKLLALPILPKDEHDKSPSLSDFRNKFCHVSSFNTSQKEILASAMRVTKTSEKDWEIHHRSAEAYYNEGMQQMQSGDFSGFGKALYSRFFFPNLQGSLAAPKGLHNDVLALPTENFDEATLRAVQMAESGYKYH